MFGLIACKHTQTEDIQLHVTQLQYIFIVTFWQCFILLYGFRSILVLEIFVVIHTIMILGVPSSKLFQKKCCSTMTFLGSHFLDSRPSFGQGLSCGSSCVCAAVTYLQSLN